VDVRLWEYPLWAWHWGDPSSDTGLAAAVLRRVASNAAARRTGCAARACYTSQLRPLSDLPGDEPVLSPGFTAHFSRDFDVLIDTAAAAAASRRYFDRLYAVADDPWPLVNART
jgi:hypothetical protein